MNCILVFSDVEVDALLALLDAGVRGSGLQSVDAASVIKRKIEASIAQAREAAMKASEEAGQVSLGQRSDERRKAN